MKNNPNTPIAKAKILLSLKLSNLVKTPAVTTLVSIRNCINGFGLVNK